MKATQQETPAAPRTPTVLVVDDEPDIVTSLRSLIEDEHPGTRTLGAASADEGLAVLAAQDVDLIVSDYLMPGMDGIEFLRSAEARYPGIRTILVTAFADGALAGRATRETNIDAFLSKPLDPDRFLRLIRTVLDT